MHTNYVNIEDESTIARINEHAHSQLSFVWNLLLATYFSKCMNIRFVVFCSFFSPTSTCTIPITTVLTLVLLKSFCFLSLLTFLEFQRTKPITTRKRKILEKINRTSFPRPRKYRWLFSEPTYWPRRSRGQYGEEINQAGIFEAEGNKSLIPGRVARSPPSPYSKSMKRKLCVCA